jgi:hypothetical protein
MNCIEFFCSVIVDFPEKVVTTMSLYPNTMIVGMVAMVTIPFALMEWDKCRRGV